MPKPFGRLSFLAHIRRLSFLAKRGTRCSPTAPLHMWGQPPSAVHAARVYRAAGFSFVLSGTVIPRKARNPLFAAASLTRVGTAALGCPCGPGISSRSGSLSRSRGLCYRAPCPLPPNSTKKAFVTNSPPDRWPWSRSEAPSAPDFFSAPAPPWKSPGLRSSSASSSPPSATSLSPWPSASSLRHPAAGSFGVYGGLYLNPFFGFLARAGYWVGIALNIGAEMVAASTYMAYWFPGVRSYIWVLIFFALLLFINLRSVSSYGRFEFWFSMIKLITIVAFIVIGASLLLTGRVSAAIHGAWRIFSERFLGSARGDDLCGLQFRRREMVAITSGESRSPGSSARRLAHLIYIDDRLSRCDGRSRRRHAVESCSA